MKRENQVTLRSISEFQEVNKIDYKHWLTAAKQFEKPQPRVSENETETKGKGERGRFQRGREPTPVAI